MEPTLRTPDPDLVLVALIQVVSGVESSHQALAEAKGDDGRVLYLDGLASHVLAEGCDPVNSISGEELDQVQVVDPMEDELSAPGLVLEGEPGALNSGRVRRV